MLQNKSLHYKAGGNSMSNKIESRKKLIKILTEMFQFDQADLDFGIYRIMNQKRDRIEEFMNEELFSKIEKSIEPLKSNINQSKVSEIENKISTLDSMNDDGSFDNKIMELKEEMEGYTSSSKTDEIESEIYSHLTDFFRRYYDEGDFISQRRYKDGVYAIPYEGEEVKLHWANYDQYYIKSSEYFYDYTFKTSFGKKVNFKLLDVETEKDNNKGDKKTFQIIGDIENNPELIDDELYIYFQYTEDKTTQKKRNEEAVNFLIEKINNLKLLNYEPMLRKGERGTSSEIEKQINRYTARNTYDYFIHKDLKGFLTRELDFYIKNEVLHLENMNPEEAEKLKEYITKAKVIESIASTIITFLAQLEEFQKGLWLKKKFIVETNYAITLDRVDEKFYSEIINNDEQIEEWIKLFAIDELDDYSEPLTIGFLKNNPYLMLDTKFFDSTFKEELIGSIDNLDESIDGVLINSDNFHALNLLQEGYKGKIDCVYIDPPYNSPQSVIMYKNNFKHSSWLALMESRLNISKQLMTENGVYNIAIDDFELINLCSFLDGHFGGYDRNIVVVNHHPQGTPRNNISRTHEYSVILTPEGKNVLKGKVSDEIEYRPLMRSGSAENNYRYGRKNSFYAILVDESNSTVVGWEAPPELDEDYPLENTEQGYKRIYPIGGDGSERVWRISANSKLLEKGNINEYVECRNNNTLYQIVTNKVTPINSNWLESRYNAGVNGTNVIADIMGDASYFSYPKSVYTVYDHLISGTEKDSNVLDFFAGSGTTAHAVINLNREDDGRRKYILVEMGEYFDTVTKPRIQKVVYSKDWKDGKPVSREGSSHAFKYVSLESYEDALNNIIFENDDMFRLLPGDSSVINEYIISYMLFEETKESKCLLNIDEMKNPFDYKMKIVEKGEQKEKKVDLIETFNYLIGLKVLRNHSTQTYDADFLEGEYGKISATIAPGTTYKFKTIEGILPTGENALVVWRNTTGDSIKDNEALNTYLDKKGIKTSDFKYDVIYVNGDNFIKNINHDGNIKVKLIEAEMKRKMFEEVVI